MNVERGRGSIDLDRSLDEAAWSGFQKLVLIFAALTFAVDGWANQVLGVATPAMIHDWNQPRAAFASVAAAGLFGIAIGTALGGLIGDRLGRRLTLIGSIGFFGLATLIAAHTHTVSALTFVRFFDGLGLGAAIPSGVALISEFTPMRRRSLAIGFCMTFTPVGGVLAGLAGTAILPHYGWRTLFTVTGSCALALAAFFVFTLPESPAFLVGRPKRRAELLKILGRFGFGFASDAEFHRRKVETSSIAALFGRLARRDTIGLWIGFFFCLMASYSIFSWLPTLLAGQGFNLAQTSAGITIFNTGGMVGGLIGGVILNRYGSRWPTLLLAAAAGLGAVLLGVMPLHPSQGLVLANIVFAVEGALVSGLTTALYALAATVYPPFVRATGIGSAAAFGRLGAVASSYGGVIALNAGGPSSYFAYIAILIGVCFLAVLVIQHHTTRSKAFAPAL